jgi:hypothetical protein
MGVGPLCVKFSSESLFAEYAGHGGSASEDQSDGVEDIRNFLSVRTL